MANADELAGHEKHDNSVYCFTQPGQLCLVYLPKGGTVPLDLTQAPGEFSLAWFDPREGGALKPAIPKLRGGTRASLTASSTDDGLAVVRR